MSDIELAGKSPSYVEDALRERLPKNWSLTRSEVDVNGNPCAFYRWTDWTDGTAVLVTVDENYACQLTVDEMCGQIMPAVMEQMQALRAAPLTNGLQYRAS